MTRHLIAIVGPGKIATDRHVPAITESPDFELAATVSRRGHAFGVEPVFATPAELYAARPDINVISFCTPPDGRAEQVREALRAGKDVMVEKPPTTTLSELADLENLSRSMGAVLFTTWHCQHNPAVDEAREILTREGVRSASVEWRENVHRWHPGQDWIWEAGGFGVFDPGINALSILTSILPFAVFVKMSELEVPQNRQAPIAARLELGSPAGHNITVTMDWRERVSEIWNIQIETEAGTKLIVSGGGGGLTVNGEVRHSGPKREYHALYKRFAQLLATRRSDIDSAPLRLTADAFLLGTRRQTEPFDWTTPSTRAASPKKDSPA